MNCTVCGATMHLTSTSLTFRCLNNHDYTPVGAEADRIRHTLSEILLAALASTRERLTADEAA